MKKVIAFLFITVIFLGFPVMKLMITSEKQGLKGSEATLDID